VQIFHGLFSLGAAVAIHIRGITKAHAIGIGIAKGRNILRDRGASLKGQQ
jgi:hypothetical protein